MRSMTGYATHSCVIEGVSVTLEIKAVNHRYLDVFVKVPSGLAAYEHEFRKIVQNGLVRGKVSLFVSLEGGLQAAVDLNEPVAKAAVRALKKMKKEFGVQGDVQLSDILRVPNVLSCTAKTVISAKMAKGLKDAVNVVLLSFVASREKEGATLKKDIMKRVAHIEKLRKQLEKVKRSANKKLYARYKERLDAIADTVVVDDDRMAKEVAVMIEKADITEELVRLDSHVVLFKNVVEGADCECGKKLDFVVQEMNREVNTIASKAQHSDIIHTVVTVKSEIEKIREQIQNIE